MPGLYTRQLSDFPVDWGCSSLVVQNSFKGPTQWATKTLGGGAIQGLAGTYQHFFWQSNIRKVGQNLNALMPEFKAGHLLKLP